MGEAIWRADCNREGASDDGKVEAHAQPIQTRASRKRDAAKERSRTESLDRNQGVYQEGNHPRFNNLVRPVPNKFVFIDVEIKHRCHHFAVAFSLS